MGAVGIETPKAKRVYQHHKRRSQIGNISLDPITGTGYLWSMRIISRKALRDFWLEDPSSEQPLRAWFSEATKADWATPAEIKAQYGNASVVGDNRVVFNVKGNDYRLVVKVNYPYRVVYIRFVGTHKQYDLIGVEKV